MGHLFENVVATDRESEAGVYYVLTWRFNVTSGLQIDLRPRAWNKQRFGLATVCNVRQASRLVSVTASNPSCSTMRRTLKGNNCFSKLTLPELVPRMNQLADLRAECTRHT